MQIRTLLRWVVRLLVKPVLSPRVPLRLQRAWVANFRFSLRSPRGTRHADVDMNGVRARCYRTPASAEDRVLLYFHGGGYVFGGYGSHGALAAQLAHAAGAQTYLVDYRLAPEHVYPAPVKDAVAAYRWLLERHAPTHIALAGDSAGGGLSVAALVAFREAGLPMPAAAALLSPFADLGVDGASVGEREERDPMLSSAFLQWCANRYCGGRPTNDPGMSPLYADLQGLPPLLIQVGSDEVLYSDAEDLAQRAREARVWVEFKPYEGLWHVFQLFAGWLKDADAAVAEIGEFLKRRFV